MSFGQSQATGPQPLVADCKNLTAENSIQKVPSFEIQSHFIAFFFWSAWLISLVLKIFPVFMLLMTTWNVHASAIAHRALAVLAWNIFILEGCWAVKHLCRQHTESLLRRLTINSSPSVLDQSLNSTTSEKERSQTLHSPTIGNYHPVRNNWSDRLIIKEVTDKCVVSCVSLFACDSIHYFLFLGKLSLQDSLPQVKHHSLRQSFNKRKLLFSCSISRDGALNKVLSLVLKYRAIHISSATLDPL